MVGNYLLTLSPYNCSTSIQFHITTIAAHKLYWRRLQFANKVQHQTGCQTNSVFTCTLSLYCHTYLKCLHGYNIISCFQCCLRFLPLRLSMQPRFLPLSSPCSPSMYSSRHPYPSLYNPHRVALSHKKKLTHGTHTFSPTLIHMHHPYP